MLYCVVSLDLVVKLKLWLKLGSRLDKYSLDSRDKTLVPVVDPSELLGTPSSFFWSVSQVDTL